ncbi:MAG: orotidine-5'-phosphate decarboxylase [Thermoplasmata archaeon]|nr:MAG: orotidine-5'-phosphate decarboxylase [Thermoplasmata archaeon]
MKKNDGIGHERFSFSYSERAKLTKNIASKSLFELMDKKKTNLVLAADVTESSELIELADNIGKKLALLKTHIDTIKDYTNDLPIELERIAKRRNFMIFEDRKFADIGKIVQNQYKNGIFKIADWANFVTAHIVSGPGIIDSIYSIAIEKSQGDKKPRGIIILAQMSSKGTLVTGNYTKKATNLGNEREYEVSGLIGAGNIPHDLKNLALTTRSGLIMITPGVHIHKKKGVIDQQYGSPNDAIKAGSDAIIVGSGIYRAPDPEEEAEKYREIAWNAYEDRLKNNN